MDIWQAIRQRCLRYGYDHRHIAKLTKLPRSTVHSYWKGDIDLTGRRLQVILNALGFRLIVRRTAEERMADLRWSDRVFGTDLAAEAADRARLREERAKKEAERKASRPRKRAKAMPTGRISKNGAELQFNVADSHESNPADIAAAREEEALRPDENDIFE